MLVYDTNRIIERLVLNHRSSCQAMVRYRFAFFRAVLFFYLVFGIVEYDKDKGHDRTVKKSHLDERL